jgi:hypothetical protein
MGLVTHPANLGGTSAALVTLAALKFAGAFGAGVVAAEGLPVLVFVYGIIMGMSYAAGAVGGQLWSAREPTPRSRQNAR